MAAPVAVPIPCLRTGPRPLYHTPARPPRAQGAPTPPSLPCPQPPLRRLFCPSQGFQSSASLATGSPPAPRPRLASGVPACVPLPQGTSSMSRARCLDGGQTPAPCTGFLRIFAIQSGWWYNGPGASPMTSLHPIHNPAAHFRMDEDIFAMGFMIPQENWRGRAESVS